MSPSLIYTLGRRDVYDPYIASDPSAAKAPGGSVWRTREDVERYLSIYPAPGFSIYGVVADWERDTQDDRGNWRALVRPAYLVSL